MRFKLFFLPALLLALVLSATVQAESINLKPFTSGSYQQIVSNNAKKPFMLAMWSITCPSCIKDMAVLQSVHKAHPELKIVMLSTDDIAESDEAQKILANNQLSDIEHWIYAEQNTQKLQFEIDPKWYGELPRTYFFDKAGQREGVSGVLSKEDYEARMSKILGHKE
jgi:thiol-disulfide isomerase/thioredoxin